MSEHLTPIAVCEALIGKPEVIGAVCGIDLKAPFGWRRAAEGRDAGDITSARHMRALLAHSETHGLGLTAGHLIRGAARAEVEAILAARGQPAPALTTRRRPRPDARLAAAE